MQEQSSSTEPELGSSVTPRASGDRRKTTAQSTRGTTPLTWVNYADPQRERKKTENRAIIRKAAKLSTLQGAAPSPLARRTPTTDLATSSAASLSCDSTEENEIETEDDILSYLRSPDPVRWVGNSDPFDSLPIATTNLSFSFLNRYCESVHIRPTCPNSCNKTQALRRRYLLPILVQSKGTLHVALLHLERDWKLVNASDHNRFQAYHQAAAISQLRKILQTSESLVPIEAFLIIGKLATAAMHEGDSSAVEAHYLGMARLFLHHWEDLASQPLFVLGVFAFWSAISDSNVCCIEKAENSVQRTTCAQPQADTGSPVWQSGVFARMRSCNLITQATLDAIPQMIQLSQLIAQARAGALTINTAKELLRLKWHCSALFRRLEASAQPVETSHFERALWLTLQLSLTLCINCTMPAVADHYCPAIQIHLSNMDLSPVLDSCPEALLWILLVVGSCCTQDQSPFFSMLLRLWADRMHINEYNNFLLHVRQFVWTSELDERASAFWHSALTLRT